MCTAEGRDWYGTYGRDVIYGGVCDVRHCLEVPVGCRMRRRKYNLFKSIAEFTLYTLGPERAEYVVDYRKAMLRQARILY